MLLTPSAYQTLTTKRTCSEIIYYALLTLVSTALYPPIAWGLTLAIFETQGLSRTIIPLLIITAWTQPFSPVILMIGLALLGFTQITLKWHHRTIITQHLHALGWFIALWFPQTTLAYVIFWGYPKLFHHTR